MGLDGANERKLPTDGYCDSPCWSPRGDKIVFSQRQGRDNYDIYIYDLATTRVARLTQGQGTNENPVWSPDGRFIVFSSTRSGRKELYIIAADGSGARKLTDQPGNSATPSWSP
jgi:TolB protein